MNACHTAGRRRLFFDSLDKFLLYPVAPPRLAHGQLSGDGAPWNKNLPRMPKLGPSGFAASWLETIVALNIHFEQLSTVPRKEETSVSGASPGILQSDEENVPRD
jgi:hypothetical protein